MCNLPLYLLWKMNKSWRLYENGYLNYVNRIETYWEFGEKYAIPNLPGLKCSMIIKKKAINNIITILQISPYRQRRCLKKCSKEKKQNICFMKIEYVCNFLTKIPVIKLLKFRSSGNN